MSLKQLLVPAYGSSLFKETQDLQNTLCKIAKSKNQMIFITRCIHHGITPKFLRSTCPIKSKYAERIHMGYRRSLLKCAKKEATSRFYHQSKLATKLKESIRDQVSSDHFEIISKVTESSREKQFIQSRTKLKNKLDLLVEEKDKKTRNNIQPSKFMKNCVLNLVNDNIPDDENEILNLGPKFAVNPTKIPYMDIITSTEMKAISLEKEEKHTVAEQLRQDMINILSNAKTPKPNLTREQRATIKRITSNEDIDIYPYDKGSGFVRISRTEGLEKIENEIGNTVLLQNDPTKSILGKFQKLLASINKELKLPYRQYKEIYPTDAVPPRLYGVIKAHKPSKNYPARTIVSTIGSPAYSVSKHLVKVIQPLLRNDVTIKNSTEFVEEAKTWYISPREIQVSYDVVAMYPSVPIGKAINVMMDMLKAKYDSVRTRTPFNLEQIKSLMELCLNHSYFLWNDGIRQLVDSGPIGLSLMVVVSEGFLQYIEEIAFNTARLPTNAACPITHKRYVDDSHDRFGTKRKAEKFLSILNSIDPKIQFTAEYEDENKSLNFLDITITNNGTGKYEFKVHRKEAITNVQIKPDSCHDEKVKYGVFKGFVHRARKICSEKYIEEELEFLVSMFMENGYEEKSLRRIIDDYQPNVVRERDDTQKFVSLPYVSTISNKLKTAFKKAGYTTMFKSGRNLSTILTSRNKPQLPRNSYPGVYRVPCKCKGNYIGHTGKKILTRGNQHEKAVFNGTAHPLQLHHSKFFRKAFLMRR